MPQRYCMCGAAEGEQHDWKCPYPLYEEKNDDDELKWLDAYLKKISNATQRNSTQPLTPPSITQEA